MKLPSILFFFSALSALAAAQSPHVIWERHLGDGSNLGRSTSTAGDLNQDGHADFMVTYRDDVTIQSGTDGSDLLVIPVPFAWMGSPTQCCTLGDVTGDGLPDYVLSISYLDRPWADNVGGIGVFSGADGSLLWSMYGAHADQFWGAVLANAGDVNADGKMDLLVGSRYHAATNGMARVYSGADGSILHTWYGTTNDDDYFSCDAAAAGDINSDGYDDIIIGAYKDDAAGVDAGMARVYSGFDGSVLCEFNGNNAGEYFGMQVDGGMDANSDGVPDLLVRASYDGASSSSPGAVYCYSGATGGLLWKVANSTSFSDTGFIGDINGDGSDDVAGCNPTDDTQLQILSGQDGSQLWLINGDWPLTHSRVVSPLGDADGDGNDDFIITAIDSADLGNSVWVYGGVGNSHDLELLVENPLLGGSNGLVWVLGPTSGQLVRLFRGTGHGRSYFNIFGTVDLQQASLIGAAVSNSSGNTRFNVFLPPYLVGTPAWLQAVGAFGDTSDVVFRVVQ